MYTIHIDGDYESFMNERRRARSLLADPSPPPLRVRRISHPIKITVNDESSQSIKPIYLHRKIPNPDSSCAAIAGITSLLSIKKAAQYFQSPSSDFNELLQNDGGIWNGKYKILKDYAVIIKEYFDPDVPPEDLKSLCFLFLGRKELLSKFLKAGLDFESWIWTMQSRVEDVVTPSEFSLQLVNRFIYQLVSRMYFVKHEKAGIARFEKHFPWYYSFGPKVSQEFMDHGDKAVILTGVLDLKEALSYFELNYQLQTVFLFMTNEFKRLKHYKELTKRKPIRFTKDDVNNLKYRYHCVAMVRSVDGKRWIARETDYDTRSYGEDLETAIKNEKKFLRERQEKIREDLREEFLIGHASQIELLEASFGANPYNIKVSGGFIGSLIVENLKWSDDSPVNVDTM